MKRFIVYSVLALCLNSCENTTNWSTIEYLEGEWTGIEITNYIKVDAYPGALTPHSIEHLTNTIDSASKTSTIDSMGIKIDQSTFILRNENKIVLTGTDATIDWTFDQSHLTGALQPIFDSLRGLFSGSQEFEILTISRKECVLYFDTLVPVYFGGNTVNVELRHTEYWQK